MNPLFLLSLPRSGSTLVQRILSSHTAITTTSEPWLLLPSVYALRKTGIAAEYEHLRLAEALEDFCEQLPKKRIDYLEEVGRMAARLYEKVGGKDAAYFLDKTPRYHLVVDELFAAFPTPKVILLWRNPLAVAASMIETWNAGKWNLHHFHIDLYTGLGNLVDAYERLEQKILAVRFEDIVSEPEAQCRKVFDYLDLPYDANVTTAFSEVRLKGRLGDPTGVSRYKTITTQSLNKWKTTFANPLRKSWGRRYLTWIGASRLNMMGYRMEDLLRELDEIPSSTNRLLSDVGRMGYGRYFVTRQKNYLKISR